MIKRVLLVGLILTTFFEVSAVAQLTGDQISHLVRTSPPRSEYPNAIAMILYRHRTIDVVSSHQQQLKEEVLLKILTGKARHVFGDLKIRFNEKYDTVKIIDAETITPDLNSVPIMAGADNIIIPPELQNAAVYNATRDRVIAFSSVEPGVVLHWKTIKTTSYKNTEQFVWGSYSFGERIPVLHDQLVIKHRSEVSLKYQIQHGLLDPEITHENDDTILSWTMKDQPQIVSEWMMPPKTNFLPKVSYSTLDNWDELAQWFRTQYFVDRKSQKSKSVMEIPELSKIILKLTPEGETRPTRESIYYWVTENIRSISLPLGSRGYTPSSIPTVVKNSYGDCLDKSYLLLNLLEKAGYQVSPVLCPRIPSEINRDVPSLNEFDFIGIVSGQTKSDFVWMDPTNAHRDFGYFPMGENSLALRIDRNSHELIEIPCVEDKRSVSEQEITIHIEDNGKVNAKCTWRGKGYYAERARAHYENATDRENRQFFNQIFTESIFNASPHNMTHSNWSKKGQSLKISFDVNSHDMNIVQDDILIFPIAEIPLPEARITFPSVNTTRNYPVLLPSRGIEVASYVLKISGDWRSAYVPEDFQISNDSMSYFQMHFFQTNTIIFRSILKWKKRMISPGEYQEVNDAWKKIHQHNQELILFERCD